MIEKIARKALTILKLRFGLPKSGFITGGSIGNLIWEIASGNKAVINDIDIFLHEFPSDPPNNENVFRYQKVELSYIESYRQITSNAINSYSIKESINNGIFNEIRYESKNTSPQLVIDSFDINCIEVGYSIEEDKFYWSNEFENFIKTGILKITSLNTPAHTAIRIVKKKYELNAKLEDMEIAICQHVISNQKLFLDINRLRFKQRYADMYGSYSHFLKNFFTLERDIELENCLSEKESIDKIYYLNPLLINKFIKLDNKYRSPGFASIKNIKGKEFNNGRQTSSMEFLFYIRNIYNNDTNEFIWNKLYYLYNRPDYIDGNVDIKDVEFLESTINLNPKIAENLKGLKISEQINIIKNTISQITKYYDHKTAIAVLENFKIPKDQILDDDDCLIMGLSVRKKISNNLNLELEI